MQQVKKKRSTRATRARAAATLKANKARKMEQWTPDQPLPDNRQEAVAVLVASREKHGMSNTAAYQSVFGNSSLKGAGANVARLLAYDRVAARVRWLRDQAVSKAVNELGVQKLDLARIALGYIQTPVTAVCDAVNKWAVPSEMAKLPPEEQERMQKLLLQADVVKAGQFGYEVRLPKKLDAINTICKIMGWTAPEKMEVSGSVDFVAVLERLAVAREARIAERMAMGRNDQIHP